MLVGYAANSSDSDTVYVVAVLVGRQEQWDELQRKWDRRTDGLPFHAADCESGRGDYKGRDSDSNGTLYRDLTALVVESGLFGFSQAVSIKDYRECFPSDDAREFPHQFCFSGVIEMCAALAYMSIPPDSVQLSLKQTSEWALRSGALYAHLAGLKEWSMHSCLDENISIVDGIQSFELQAADLLARQTLKWMESLTSQTRRHQRPSFMQLRRNPRFQFYFADRQQLQLMRERAHALLVTETGALAYNEWLHRNGFQSDNMTNRLRFLTSPEHRHRLAVAERPWESSRVGDESFAAHP